MPQEDFSLNTLPGRPPGSRLLRPAERQVLLWIGDLFMQYLAVFLALYIWSFFWFDLGYTLEYYLSEIPPWFYFLPVVYMVLISGLYETNRAHRHTETLKGLAFAALISLGMYLLVYFFFPPRTLPRLGVLFYIILAPIVTLAWRIAFIRIFTAPQFMRRVFLIGGGESGQMLLRIINNTQPQPFILVGIIDDDPQKRDTVIEGYPVLGNSSQMLELIAEHKVSDLIVAISGMLQPAMFEKLLSAQESGIEITRMPVAYEELLSRVPIRYLEADWIVRSFVDQVRGNIYYDIAKRFMDLIGALFGLVILAILTPLVGLGILLDSGWPVFFSQMRLGRGGKEYAIFKFRTMYPEKNPGTRPAHVDEAASRTTRFGAFLRRTHIDEIPQFINVLRGEMSLVGPRAEWVELVNEYQHQVPFYRARLLVKPGLTGWAQVNQDYAGSVEETMIKLEYDLYYIKRRSLWMDLQILLRTPALMVGLKGK
jgi:exopolysaccharide biosynthesis polyprenyl glycosylphosphotransferase